MLVRSANRRQRRHVSQMLAATFARLNLPWLAPAQLRWTATHHTSNASAQTRSRLSRCPSRNSPSRCLATTSDAFIIPPDRNFPPPGYRSDSARTAQATEQDGTARRSFYEFGGLRGSSSPFISLNDLETYHPDPVLTIQPGISGSLEELLQHLHISIRIGRTMRAESIVRRLVDQTSPIAPEVAYAHTLFLEDMLRKIESHGRDSTKAKAAYAEMQRWFEVLIRGRGTPLSERMLVLMIKASIRTLSTSRRDRAIRRYTGLARGVSNELFDDVTQSEELDDEEFLVVGRATSELIATPPEADCVDQMSSNTPSAPEKSKDVASSAKSKMTYETVDLLKAQIEELPQARSVQQRGRGLTSIKFVLDEFAKVAPAPVNATEEEKLERARARQRVLEESAVDAAIKSWQQASNELRKIGIHTVMQSRPLAALMWQWQEALVPLLTKELAEVKQALDTNAIQDVDRRVYGPYMELLPMDKLAAITILHVLSMFSSIKTSLGVWDSFLKVGALTASLGNAIRQEAIVELSKQRLGRQKSSRTENKRTKRLAARKNAPKSGAESLADTNIAHSRQMLMIGSAASEWPKDVIVKLGALLLSKLTEAAQLPVTRKHPRTGELVTQMQPAFLYRVKYSMGKRIGIMTPNPALQEKMKVEPFGGAIAKRMPMVVEPKPWKGWSDGGYLHYPTAIARMSGDDGTGRQYFMAALKKGDLEQVFTGLNALGSVSWKVDKDVLAVQLEAWNSGEAIGNFAPHHPQLDLPPEPDTSIDPAARRRWLREVAEIENKRSGLHSQRCFQNFQLEIARTMANETLYFPHNIDFRGRAYPIPPYLNHMGADNVRGLLTFAKGKALGERGLRWLKIHLATVAGYDKASLDERVQFTMDHLDDIFDSARRPLDGNRWWLKSEDAWQTLAACFELTKALESANPHEFVSHLPVHQDGTCNGLQHYAALGGDEAGAKQVNLEPGDRPADVYTAVADAVREHVRRDAEDGNPIAQKLHGRITRKCVKQPVMTNVYGVTFYGAKAQVRKQLEVLFPEVGMYDEVNLGHMSLYIATKIFQCLGDMFRGAQAIQEWLGVCASRISTYLTPAQIRSLSSGTDITPRIGKKSCGRPTSNKAAGKKANALAENGESAAGEDDSRMTRNSKPFFKSTVIWTTPLGIPVAQPYRSTKTRSITTNLQTVSISEPQMWHPVSKRKQLQAFPPNFIHSLDATHMLLSAIKCTEIGLSFASVHDSFWTHACDVDTLSSVLRDAFVKVHSDDVVGRLREELTARYKGGMYLASVEVSLETAKHIVAARREAIKDGRTEIIIEADRLRLLNSQDPDERARGSAMVTPGSIVDREGHVTNGVTIKELGDHALGSIPETAQTISGLSTSPEEVEATNSDADADNSVEAELEHEDAEDSHATAQEEEAIPIRAIAQGPAHPEGATRKMHIWLPMEFPPVPAKGTFDVTRLRESKYFFH